MEQTIFLDFVGYCVKTKIYDYILTNRELDFTFNDVVKEMQINRQGGYTTLKQLEKEKLINKSRKFKGIQLYKANLKDPRLKYLMNTYDACLSKSF